MLGGDGEGRMGGASCRLVRKVARLVRMTVGEQAADHGPRVIWAVGGHVVVLVLEGDGPLCCCLAYAMLSSISIRLSLRALETYHVRLT